MAVRQFHRYPEEGVEVRRQGRSRIPLRELRQEFPKCTRAARKRPPAKVLLEHAIVGRRTCAPLARTEHSIADDFVDDFLAAPLPQEGEGSIVDRCAISFRLVELALELPFV